MRDKELRTRVDFLETKVTNDFKTLNELVCGYTEQEKKQYKELCFGIFKLPKSVIERLDLIEKNIKLIIDYLNVKLVKEDSIPEKVYLKKIIKNKSKLEVK